MQQQRQQLQDSLGLGQHLLQCVVHQLPLHPRQWSMVAATCLELRDAVVGGREALRGEMCSEHRVERLEETRWRGQWAGELLVELAEDEETAEAIRVMVAGAPVDCRGKWNRTPLIWAARRGDIELVDALISAGAQLDLQDDEGDTAVMVGSAFGHTETAVALIIGGAQLDLQNDRGWTALMEASNGGHTETAVALINAGAELDLQNDEGCTASDLASAQGHPEIVQALQPRCVVCGGPSQQCSGCMIQVGGTNLQRTDSGKYFEEV